MFGWLFKNRRRFSVEAAGISECGPVRAENQDHFFIDPRKAAFVVADGMGGGEGGAKASELVCAAFEEAAGRARGFADLMRRSAEAVSAANAEIRRYAAQHGYRQMGSTAAALFLNPEGGPEAVISHIGDSRIYRLRGGRLELLTHDHTVAGELSRRSSCRALAAEISGRTGYLSHVLTRAVGIEDNATPDWRKLDLREGDAFLVCSDGVYDMVDEAGLQESMSAGSDASETAELLARAVMEGGATDNYTCIVVRIGGRT